MTKVRIGRTAVSLLLIALAMTSCNGYQPTVLEAHDVQSFRTTAIEVGGHTRLQLSGLALHSALAAERMEHYQHGAVLDLRVRLAPARPGLSGSFDYAIDVPDSVRSVTFGGARTVIWQRPAAR